MENKELFTLTKPKGSVIYRPNGDSIVLNEIPEEAFEIWKSGSDVFSLKKSGISILESLSKTELEEIYNKRLPNEFTVELQCLRKAIKEKADK